MIELDTTPSTSVPTLQRPGQVGLAGRGPNPVSCSEEDKRQPGGGAGKGGLLLMMVKQQRRGDLYPRCRAQN